MSGRAKYIIGFAVLFLTFAYLFNSLKVIWSEPNKKQWDFKTYYHAGEAYNQDLDPYDRKNLASVSLKRIKYSFVYPPLTLQLFRLLPRVEYEAGHKLWLILKILSLVALVVIWKQYFIRDVSLFLMIPFTLFAFDGSVFWDIKAGNVAIFEQLFLWLAFWAFLKNRYILFVVLVLAGSIFKLSPLLFLFLLLVSEDNRKWWLLGGGLVCIALFMLMNYLISPELFDSFVNSVLAVEERGDKRNYGMFAFWDDVYLSIKGTAEVSYRPYLALGSYLACAAAVLWVSISSWVRLRNKGTDNLTVYSILLFCCTYALIVPRFKCYSFILLIPACFYIISSIRSNKYAYMILLLGIIPASTPFLEEDTINQFFTYYPLYLALVVWLYLVESRGERGETAHRADPVNT